MPNHLPRVCRLAPVVLCLLLPQHASSSAPASESASRTRHVTIEAVPARTEAWRKVLQSMPARWAAARSVVVREVTNDELWDTLEEAEGNSRPGSATSVVDGFYQNRGKRSPVLILLSDALKPDAGELVLAHEYAHYVWDELLTAEDRSDYRRLWGRQMERGRLVTRYAEEGAEEGFAEAVSHYVLRADALRRRDPASHAFIERFAGVDGGKQ